jgi:hypothetical protein
MLTEGGSGNPTALHTDAIACAAAFATEFHVRVSSRLLEGCEEQLDRWPLTMLMMGVW